MKIIKLIKKILKVGLGFSITYLSYLLIKAYSFKKSCDINKNSLDSVAIFQNLNINYKKQDIHDFKLGCFIGTMECNLTDSIFNQEVTDLTINIEQGIITLYIPARINVLITSNRSNQSNVLNYHHNLETNTKLIIINENIKFGLLVIQTSQKET